MGVSGLFFISLDILFTFRNLFAFSNSVPSEHVGCIDFRAQFQSLMYRGLVVNPTNSYCDYVYSC